MDMMISARILTIIAGFFFGISAYCLWGLYKEKPEEYKKQATGLWVIIVLCVLALYTIWTYMG